MSHQHDDGSLTLTSDEAERLRAGVRRWEEASYEAGNAAGLAVLHIAEDVRELVSPRQARR